MILNGGTRNETRSKLLLAGLGAVAEVTRIAEAIVAALAVGVALVDIAAVAGLAALVGLVAPASVVDTGALDQGSGELTDGENLRDFILGLDSDGKGENGEESEGLGEHFCLVLEIESRDVSLRIVEVISDDMFWSCLLGDDLGRR